MLVLSLFPGADLLGRAFEEEGFTVVRGPDLLWGGDVASFRGIKGKFDVLIGGPPCQVFSKLTSMAGTDAVNLIPEFLRIDEETDPRISVMENVEQAIPHGPAWPRVLLRDWDCGGHTHRRRVFWFKGMDAPAPPPAREGEPAWSVCASQWKGRTGIKNGGTKGMHRKLHPNEAARLQGFDDLAQRIAFAQPGGVSVAGQKCLAIHMLGNGVPRAMGLYVARAVKHALAAQERAA